MIAELYIGIDPDVAASGFAVWNKKQFTELSCLSLPDLFTALKAYNEQYHIHIRLEAGWLIKCFNWHAGGARSANSVGRNHEIGRQIEKYCITNNISHELVKPLGYSAYTPQYFCMLTKWNKRTRTNSDMRVAGMLVYGL